MIRIYAGFRAYKDVFKNEAPPEGAQNGPAQQQCLKSKSPFTVGAGGGVHDGQLPTFDAESKSVKIQKSLYGGGGGA